MDRRFICQDCGTKWFVPDDLPPSAEPQACAACAGPLVRLDDGQPAARP